ncbi:MAG: glucose-1-phosphate thymidylyltransferase RfbA [Candidatus Handelsmanbacteria bacterium]|nr:glucose-1-phosphate thymidylyltransferase RfbA [Candidatus Handelsmanbacteria bacterium]
MKGIILAGGAGSRLYPLTRIVCKQLLPVYDKPMICYPLSILMLGGIREICIVSTPRDLPLFEAFLGDGAELGLRFSYVVQVKPEGIAQAFLLAKDFIGGDAATLILGDNVFYGDYFYNEEGFARTVREFKEGGLIFGYYVSNPQEFGVLEFDQDSRVISIEEKPSAPKSNYVVPGLYLYDQQVLEICQHLQPSARGEYEITDVNRTYLNRGQLRVQRLGRGIAWLDTGTPSSLQEANAFIEAVERRQGLKIACLEEIAYRQGFVDRGGFQALTARLPKCDYRHYLERALVQVG